ncbi:hypothetical protein JCGZ_19442 [Jatropha curcas]|uniref:Uncharacterized protein n=1 Tax=Jatropha curcas TaxID=180498 RepID=A0A067K350_JATCU|nr:hypothetical protein JCGZ_19442 [Jatropha curcas]
MSSGKSGDGDGDRIPIKDPQLKLFMEAIQGQFRTFNNLFQDIREELQEIKASQSSNTTRAHPQARFQVHDDEDTEDTNVTKIDGDLVTRNPMEINSMNSMTSFGRDPRSK